MDQSDTFRQGESPKTGMNHIGGLSDRPSLPSETLELGKYIKTSTNSEEDKSIQVYHFGKYKVEVKLDPEGRPVYIKGYLTPEPKKYYEPLFDLDEEFPEDSPD